MKYLPESGPYIPNQGSFHSYWFGNQVLQSRIDKLTLELFCGDYKLAKTFTQKVQKEVSRNRNVSRKSILSYCQDLVWLIEDDQQPAMTITTKVPNEEGYQEEHFLDFTQKMYSWCVSVARHYTNAQKLKELYEAGV